MSPPEVIFTALVFLIGIPAMWKNTTAIGLVASWLVVQLAWVTGHVWSTKIQFLCDVVVIAIMIAKPDYEDGFPYRNVRSQFAALLWTERTPCDRIIGAIFPLMWILYLAPISDYYRWWGLWWLAAAQFIVAGIEPLRLWLTGKLSHHVQHETPPRVEMTGLAAYV